MSLHKIVASAGSAGYCCTRCCTMSVKAGRDRNRPLSWGSCRSGTPDPSMGAHGGEVVQGRLGRSPCDGCLPRPFSAASVAVLACCMGRLFAADVTTCLQSTLRLSVTVADLAISASARGSQTGPVRFRCGQPWWSALRRWRQANHLTRRVGPPGKETLRRASAPCSLPRRETILYNSELNERLQ
jgi:hypothetical protein